MEYEAEKRNSCEAFFDLLHRPYVPRSCPKSCWVLREPPGPVWMEAGRSGPPWLNFKASRYAKRRFTACRAEAGVSKGGFATKTRGFLQRLHRVPGEAYCTTECDHGRLKRGSAFRHGLGGMDLLHVVDIIVWVLSRPSCSGRPAPNCRYSVSLL